MASLKLTNGEYTLVDDQDYDFLNQWEWHCTVGYAARTEYPQGLKGRGVHILMHRVLMGMPDGLQVDHANRNPLDNRKSNLRIATRSQNQWNRGLQNNNSSGSKGVSWDKVNNKWRAAVNMQNKYINLGRFNTIEEAVAVRTAYIANIHGEFARQS